MSISGLKHVSKVGEPFCRVEIFTGEGRRRSWSADEKAAIVAESHATSESVAALDVAAPRLFVEAVVATLKAMLVAKRQRAERLEGIIAAMRRRAETLPEDQLPLGLEDVEQAAASDEIAVEGQAACGAASAKRRANRGALPAHLPRIETVCDLDDKTCPCCHGPLHQIGEDRSERLDVVPAQFRVLVTRRPRYACRAFEDIVVQKPAPARLIEGDLPTETAIALVLVSKYADHLPLYRQSQIYARKGIRLDRSKLAD